MAWYNIQDNSVYLNWGGVRRGIVRASNGDLWAGYCEELGGYITDRAYVEKSTDDGVTWGSKYDVSGEDKSYFVAMCIDSNDNIFVLWDGSGGTYCRKRSPEGSWSSSVLISASYYSVAIVIDSNDNIYAVLIDANAGPALDYVKLYKSNNGGLSFSLKATPLSVVTGYTADIAIGPTDNIHVVQDNKYRMSEDGGSSWNAIETMSVPWAGDGISIVIDALDVPHVLVDWGNGNKIQYNNRRGGSWSDVITLADVGISGEWEIFCTLSIDRAGILYAVWCGGLCQENISMRYSNDGGYNWSAEIQLYEGIKTWEEQVWYPNSMNSIYPKIAGISTNLRASGWNCVMYDNNWDVDWNKIKYSSGIIAIEDDYAFVA